MDSASCRAWFCGNNLFEPSATTKRISLEELNLMQCV
jgi:hypothetical protein